MPRKKPINRVRAICLALPEATEQLNRYRVTAPRQFAAPAAAAALFTTQGESPALSRGAFKIPWQWPIFRRGLLPQYRRR